MIGVWKFDYEMKSQTGELSTWTAYIAAHSIEEAIDYLKKNVGLVRITTQGMECRLDAISDKVRDIIVQSSKKRPGRPKGSTKKKTTTTTTTTKK